VKITFSSRAWSEYPWWQGEDQRGLAKLNALIIECSRSPFKGIGKPEPLGGNLSGWWSRRITQEHRLVYRVTGSGAGQALEIAQCRYHY
jgi:toxin YoeB